MTKSSVNGISTFSAFLSRLAHLSDNRNERNNIKMDSHRIKIRIDERIIRLVLGDRNYDNMNFEPIISRNEILDYLPYKENEILINKNIIGQFQGLNENINQSNLSQIPAENMMFSMARVMEAVESIVRNGKYDNTKK